MDIFWCVMKYVEIGVIWLLKVKTHFDKLEKIQSKIKLREVKKHLHKFLT